MKKIISLVLCAVLLFSLLAGCSAKSDTTTTTASVTETSASAQTITVTDHNGNVVTLPKDIQRIAVCNIYPLPSVIAVFLGSAEKLVGIHPTSMTAAQNGTLGEIYPEILNASTSYMDGDTPNVEELLKLNPDVVFYSASTEEVGESIRNAGMNAVAVSATNWGYDIIETYRQWIELLSDIFPDYDKSTAVTDYSNEICSMISERVAAVAQDDKKDVFFLFQYDDSHIMTSGKNFFGQYWATAVGGINVSQELDSDKGAAVNMEQIYNWDPDIIFITNFTKATPDDLYTNAIGSDDWSGIEAVEDKEVYKMPLGIYRSYTPSADTPITLLWLAKTVYPELFEDIDIAAQAKDYYLEIYGVSLTDEQISSMFNQ